MEGLVDGAGSVPAVRDWRPEFGPRAKESTLERWLAFLFFVMMGLLLLVYLTAAALP